MADSNSREPLLLGSVRSCPSVTWRFELVSRRPVFCWHANLLIKQDINLNDACKFQPRPSQRLCSHYGEGTMGARNGRSLFGVWILCDNDLLFKRLVLSDRAVTELHVIALSLFSFRLGSTIMLSKYISFYLRRSYWNVCMLSIFKIVAVRVPKFPFLVIR